MSPYVAVDTLQLDLLPLIDPWITPTPCAQQPRRGPALEKPYRVRCKCAARNRFYFYGVIPLLVAILPAAALAYSVRQNGWDRHAWGVLTLLMLLPVVGIAAYFLNRREWENHYRWTYFALARKSLALRVAEPEFWRVFLYPELGAPGMRFDAVPTELWPLLKLATFELGNLRMYARKAEGDQLERALTSSRLTNDLPARHTRINARYAALYDFFFEAQDEFHVALRRAEMEEERQRQRLDAGQIGL